MRSGSMRDCKAWEDEGLCLGTSSNEAAKFYDECLTQYVGWYDDPTMGGLGATCEKMYNADPNFFLGQAFNLSMQLLGTENSIKSSESLNEDYNSLKSSLECQKEKLSAREVRHGEACILWAEGHLSEAASVYQEILLDHPTDIHALRMVSDTYFYLGKFAQYRDNIARVLPIYEAKSPPLKSYLYGLYAFGLEETNEFENASKMAQKGLDENPNDGWATHALAHVYEMKGRTQDGLHFMNSSIEEWEKSNHLARHNHWHRALFHIENEEWDEATQILETKVLPRALKGRTMFDLVDCSSLLWRLKMLDPDFDQRITSKYISDARELSKSIGMHHISLFNDAHQMLSIGFKESTESIKDSDELLETLSTCSGELMSDNSIQRSLLQAIAAFRNERYADVVNHLEPIRYDLPHIGGSGAQRDIFNLMLIVAAMKSTSSRDRRLCKVLIMERENFKGSTKLSSRLFSMLE